MTSWNSLGLANLIDQLSSLSAIVISVLCGIHVIAFCLLWIWSRRDLKRIAHAMDAFTRDLRYRSILGSTSHISDQIEAFISDVSDVLDDSSRKEERETCLQRMSILDEQRRYLDSLLFETSYNMCRTMIEAYPLAGVLGTILAIGAAMQTDGGAATVGGIVERFGDAIWSTFAGLAAAILLMFINSMLETPFERLNSNRKHVHNVVARAKRELSLSAGVSQT